jgi:hypothetical protein
MSSKSLMLNGYITESSIHYVTGLLDRYMEKHPSKHHADALKEFRELSNKLLETLEKPTSLNVVRHRIERKD